MKRDLRIVTSLRIKEVAWARTKNLASKSIRPEQCFGCAPHDEAGFPGAKILAGPARREHMVGVSDFDDRRIPKVESFTCKATVPQRKPELGLQRIIGRQLNIHPFPTGNQAEEAKKQEKAPHESRTEPIHRCGVKVSD